MNDIMKIVKPLEDSGLLIKDMSNLLGNLITGKDTIRTGEDF